MIHEIAVLVIDPSRSAEFEAAVAAARPHFVAAPGCTSFGLQRVIEEPGTYRLVVGWDSVDAHMVDFRGSDGFQQWRALAAPFFVAPPSVVHVETII